MGNDTGARCANPREVRWADIAPAEFIFAFAAANTCCCTACCNNWAETRVALVTSIRCCCEILTLMKTMERQRSMTLVMMIDSEFEGNGIDDSDGGDNGANDSGGYASF